MINEKYDLICSCGKIKDITDYIENIKKIERKELLEEIENIIMAHKDCREYHKISSNNGLTFYRISCIAQILIDLKKSLGEKQWVSEKHDLYEI